MRDIRTGWKLLYTPDATLTHLGAHSTSRNPEKSSAQFYKSQSYFSLEPVIIV